MTRRQLGDASAVSYFAGSKVLQRAEQLRHGHRRLARAVSQPIIDLQD